MRIRRAQCTSGLTPSSCHIAARKTSFLSLFANDQMYQELLASFAGLIKLRPNENSIAITQLMFRYVHKCTRNLSYTLHMNTQCASAYCTALWVCNALPLFFFSDKMSKCFNYGRQLSHVGQQIQGRSQDFRKEGQKCKVIARKIFGPEATPIS